MAWSTFSIAVTPGSGHVRVTAAGGLPSSGLIATLSDVAHAADCSIRHPASNPRSLFTFRIRSLRLSRHLCQTLIFSGLLLLGIDAGLEYHLGLSVPLDTSLEGMLGIAFRGGATGNASIMEVQPYEERRSSDDATADG
jgi:hypothetical protein